MLYQIQYRIRGQRPTASLISDARKAFQKGLPLPRGVKVHPIAWTGTIKGLKAALRGKTAFIGHAGIVKEFGRPDMSLCDYDSEYRPAMHVIIRVARMLDIWPLWMREDKTVRGWHMVIQWNREFAPAEMIALQCVLGSDIQREMYNLGRVLSGKNSDRWNLLFERKL